MTEMTVAELAERVGGVLDGPGAAPVRGVNSLAEATGEQVSFLANPRYESQLAQTRAAAVLVARDYGGARPAGALVRCADPYAAFRELMVAFHGFREAHFEGVDPRAAIDPTAELAAGVAVGPFVTVGPRCRVGAGTALYPGVYLGPDVRVGAGCMLHPNVVIYEGCVLGDRVTVHAGTSIGHDGFGYVTGGQPPAHAKIPQAGWVEIGDDVEIGAGCAIDRATLGATQIGAGTKLSDLVALGHGTRLGRHCLVVAQAGFAGSAQVGDYCVFAGQVGVNGHVRVGDGVRVAAQSGIVDDIEGPGEFGGSPAMPLTQARRVWATYTRLPELRSELRALRKRVAELERRLGETGPAGEGGAS